jgi:hypothetical protein
LAGADPPHVAAFDDKIMQPLNNPERDQAEPDLAEPN